jgi:hypothetical protein
VLVKKLLFAGIIASGSPLAELCLLTYCTLVSCSADFRPEDGSDTSGHIRTTLHYVTEVRNIYEYWV